jgi:hypothetical protein
LLRYVPPVGKGEELVWMDGHVAKFMVISGIVRQRPQESVWTFFGQQRVELAVNGSPLLVVECQFTFHDKTVYFRV